MVAVWFVVKYIRREKACVCEAVVPGVWKREGMYIFIYICIY